MPRVVCLLLVPSPLSPRIPAAVASAVTLVSAEDLLDSVLASAACVVVVPPLSPLFNPSPILNPAAAAPASAIILPLLVTTSLPAPASMPVAVLLAVEVALATASPWKLTAPDPAALAAFASAVMFAVLLMVSVPVGPALFSL